LKYYYNDNGDIENKEFIISFLEKDNYLIIDILIIIFKFIY